LTKEQTQMLERVHTSCLRGLVVLGVRLSDRHRNAHIRESCGIATLSAYITANRLRWLGWCVVVHQLNAAVVELPPAPTRVLLDPTASTLPMCDGSGVGFGF
jgi:hypothetical protein